MIESAISSAFPYFFIARERAGTAYDIIRWWECRRFSYNVIVGTVGVATSLFMFLHAMVAEAWIGVPVGIPDPPIIAILGIVVYGFMANLCYTFGWLVELGVAHYRDLPNHGLVLLRRGTYSSIFLTLLPAVLCPISLILQAYFGTFE